MTWKFPNLCSLIPNEEEARLARESSRRSASFLTTGRADVRLGIRQDDRREESVAIPTSAFRLLVGTGKGLRVFSVIPCAFAGDHADEAYSQSLSAG